MAEFSETSSLQGKKGTEVQSHGSTYEHGGNVMEVKSPSSKFEKGTSYELDIYGSEKALGLTTEYDRQAEASLFIDKKFLSYALVTGVTKHPERVFGEAAWADYLDGRVYAKEYGNRELTPDFIKYLHKKLTQRTNPEIGGKIRDVGVLGGSFDELGEPVTYTPEQVRAIEENPKLSFRKVEPDDPECTTGMILYPHRQMPPEDIQEAVNKDLEELCDWFNKAKQEDRYNPHIVAGLLQHRLISIHPFEDANGGLSRMLMNWSLENDGEQPSLIDDPTEDILTDEESWIASITKGSNQYKELKRRQAALDEAGIDNINALFDLGQDKAFYDYIFKHLKLAPPLPTNGDKHKHQVYEDFLKEFKGEMGTFQEYLHGSSKLKIADEEREISQGGLITPEFMQFASSPNTQVVPLELRKQFFTDIEAYRGGMVQGEVDDQVLLQMFQGYTGVGTGYRSLRNAHVGATSLQQVNQQAIRESMEYYNKMFASQYFAKKHPDVKNPYADKSGSVRNLSTTITEHIGGSSAIWNSPFASTSLNYAESRGWARRFHADYAKDSRHGVLFKTHLPREGMVMTFGDKVEGLHDASYTFPHEAEALVAGGLEPTSFTGIEVYDRDNQHGNPGLTAKRVDADGQVKVVIEDRHGEFVVQRTYTYDQNARSFVLSDELTTDVLSTKPIDTPAPFDTFDYGKWKGYAGHIQKEYDSPFIQEYNEKKIEKYIYNQENKNYIEKKYNNPSYFSELNSIGENEFKIYEKDYLKHINKIENNEIIYKNKIDDPFKKKSIWSDSESHNIPFGMEPNSKKITKKKYNEEIPEINLEDLIGPNKLPKKGI